LQCGSAISKDVLEQEIIDWDVPQSRCGQRAMTAP